MSIPHDSSEHTVFSATETYAQLLAASHTVPSAGVVVIRVRKHRSLCNSTISLEEAYQYKRGRALGTVPRPPRLRGVPRQLRVRTSSPPPPATQRCEQDQQYHHQQQQREQLQSESGATPPSLPVEVAQDRPVSSVLSTTPTPTPTDQLTALIARAVRQDSELVTFREQVGRAVRLAEQAATEIVLLQQQLQPRIAISTRKRKQPPVSSVEIDPTSLLDEPFTSQQIEEHVDRCFEEWRLEEDGVTIGWACINAVLTLFNHRLQQANDAHLRFLTSYPGMEQQNSDDPVIERCMGIDLAKGVRYVVAPVSVEGNHWALIVWDNEQRELLLLDSLRLVTIKHASRMRRLLMQGSGKTKRAVRVPVMAQKDSVSCGLFVLCFASYMASNGATWRESISGAVFCIDHMRNWLRCLEVPNENVNFTLDQLPTFLVSDNVLA